MLGSAHSHASSTHSTDRSAIAAHRRLPFLNIAAYDLPLSRCAEMTAALLIVASILFLATFSLVATLSPAHRPRRSSPAPHPSAIVLSTPLTDRVAPSVAPSAGEWAADPTWTIDASKPIHSVHPDLYGIFFEEYSYSGEGGLYQQQIQNTNFETTLSSYAPWEPLNSSGVQYILQLDTMRPLNAYNPTSLLVTTKGKAGQQAGVVNPGFWGISLINRTGFDVTLHAYSATIKQVVVSLTSRDGQTVYGSITFPASRPPGPPSAVRSRWTRPSRPRAFRSPMRSRRRPTASPSTTSSSCRRRGGTGCSSSVRTWASTWRT